MGRWLDQFLMFWDYDIFYLPAHCLGAFCLFRLFLMFFDVYLMTFDRGRRTRQKIPGYKACIWLLFSFFLLFMSISMTRWGHTRSIHGSTELNDFHIFISSPLSKRGRKEEGRILLTDGVNWLYRVCWFHYLSIRVYLLSLDGYLLSSFYFFMVNNWCSSMWMFWLFFSGFVEFFLVELEALFLRPITCSDHSWPTVMPVEGLVNPPMIAIGDLLHRVSC